MGFALKVAFGIGCFVVGAACVTGVVCTVPFIPASDAAIPATFGTFGRLFYGLLSGCCAKCAGTTTK